MNKIKYFMLAMMAFVASASFTACSSDDDNNKNSGKQSNYEEYQKAVNQTVNSQKKSDKVILLVAFGSTWEQAYDTFDKVVDEYKSAFSGWDVYLSFSSAICINRMWLLKTTTIQSTGSPLLVWQATSRSWYSRCR